MIKVYDKVKTIIKMGGIFFGLILAPKIKYCLTLYKFGIKNARKSFKGFTNVSENLNRKECFKMFIGDKIVAKVPLSWRKII